MNEIEAKAILGQELARYRARSYSKLLALVDESETFERTSPSGVTYQIEIEAFFDDKSRRTLLVMGAIDDGGWRAFNPLCSDFIIAPDGSSVGE